MEFRVLVVEDDDLPVDWVIARGRGVATLLVRRSPWSCDKALCLLLGAAWAASAALGGGQPILSLVG